MSRPRLEKKQLIGFEHIGEYRLRLGRYPPEPRAPSQTFHCAIRNREELHSERIELHPGELISRVEAGHEDVPLLRVDGDGLWAFVESQKVWWPLRRQTVSLGLDSAGRARLKFHDPK